MDSEPIDLIYKKCDFYLVFDNFYSQFDVPSLKSAVFAMPKSRSIIIDISKRRVNVNLYVFHMIADNPKFADI